MILLGVAVGGLGFGLLAPMFFVTAGLRFDLDALRADDLLLVPLLIGVILATRALPTRLCLRVLPAAMCRRRSC